STVLDRVGLDATVLLAFFKMSYKLFAFCGLFSLIVLSPIKFSIYYSKHEDFLNDPVETPVDLPEHSLLLVSYVLFTWVFSLATFYFTFYNYREFSKVRHRYYCKWKNSITTKTVMVTVIPRELQKDEALKEFYESLNLGPVKEAVVYKNVRKLRHALEKREYYLRKLEEAYAEFFGNPCFYPDYDPDEVHREFEQNKTINLSRFQAKRRKIKTGFLGIFGEEVDKIEYYTNLFNQCDKMVERGRHGSYNSASVGFVTFESITSAQMAAQILMRPEPYHCNTVLAPEPRDVYWRNLTIRQREMLFRSIIVNVATVIVVIFWSVIFTFISSILSLEALTKTLP
ncbi:13556_t:CDS:2, partial [Acaulospora morrowiae]